ncbi:hypothetical protein OO5_00589 [Enterococcus faecalis V583]|uniref:hypothetical protein n=1 Tax=Enterococcus faecalis TaxID=1351 RepID=UPI00033777B3|nr:hypothetical protein [Enterococcus faecalis]EOT51999.1 hypothetical protein OO5_00589 [Enterococcus faecalis V583]
MKVLSEKQIVGTYDRTVKAAISVHASLSEAERAAFGEVSAIQSDWTLTALAGKVIIGTAHTGTSITAAQTVAVAKNVETEKRDTHDLAIVATDA